MRLGEGVREEFRRVSLVYLFFLRRFGYAFRIFLS